jgi:hypothetical protein
MGAAEIAAAPSPLIEALRLSARRPENAKSVASLMHAINRFRRPRPESVLKSAELAAIRTSTIFVLGADDPYLSVEHARQSNRFSVSPSTRCPQDTVRGWSIPSTLRVWSRLIWRSANVKF